MFKQKKFRTLGEWKRWYNKKYPKAVEKAINTIYNAFEKAIVTDKKLIEINYKAKRNYRYYIKRFVENLIYNQTFSGLKIQEAILTKMASIMKQKIRMVYWTRRFKRY